MAVYFDHNATTPVDGQVLEAMLPYLKESYGNPSSPHAFGRVARKAVEHARERVASLVNAHPSQIIFTGGGTEANNMALRGVAAAAGKCHIAVSAVEHSSVLEPARALGREGWDIDYIPVSDGGCITRDRLAQAMKARTRLLSVMTANNETGVVQDIAALSAHARDAGVLFHTDAVQAAGKIAVDFQASGAHLMSLSAHKIYGPKGVGALVVDKAVDMLSLILGGGQEKGRRSGTENVAGIVGFGAAAELAASRLTANHQQLLVMRERLETGLAKLPFVKIFAGKETRLPNTVFFAVEGIDGETLMMNLDMRGFAVASGSACESGRADPSHVLLAMGVAPDLARGAVRVSLGTGNTIEDVVAFLDVLQRQVGMISSMTQRLSIA